LGVNVEADVEVVEACLNEIGICFCFAPMLHPAMRHVAPIRQKLGTSTIFNILGPLANPANAQVQLLGVSKEGLLETMAEALIKLGTNRAIVVYGSDGIDEVTLGGPTEAIEVVGGNQRRFQWHPEDFGLPKVKLDELRVENASQSAMKIRSVLQGRPGPATDIVIANAAAALWTAGRDSTIGQCVGMAREAIESGAANDLLAQLVERTNAEHISTS
jgi:anthranilate phosphoribosyltransferase